MAHHCGGFLLFVGEGNWPSFSCMGPCCPSSLRKWRVVANNAVAEPVEKP